VKNEKIWYELDAFAKTYSSIISEGRTTCFRLSALFSENIDLKVLRNVAVLLERKYPFYNSELKKGIFWNYLQQKKTHFMIEEEKTYPCTDIQKDNPLRIIYFNNKLSIEIAHFLTDGKGAMLFFQDLIEEYLEEKYFSERSRNRNFENVDIIIENKGKKEYQTKLSVEVDKISLDTLKNFMNVLANEKIYSLNRSKNGTYIFTIESQNATNKQAYQNAMARFNDIQQKLGRAGIPANTVKISGYDNKEISLEKRTSKRKDIQVVSHDIEVETRDLKNLGNIISVANALGIGTNGSIEYDIDNKQQLENELYENAYKEALKKAQVILGKTDLNLKNPVTITDKSNGVIHPYRDYNYSYNMSADYDEEDLKKSDRELLDESSRRNIVISPKKLNISKTVYIEFEMN